MPTASSVPISGWESKATRHTLQEEGPQGWEGGMRVGGGRERDCWKSRARGSRQQMAEQGIQLRTSPEWAPKWCLAKRKGHDRLPLARDCAGKRCCSYPLARPAPPAEAPHLRAASFSPSSMQCVVCSATGSTTLRAGGQGGMGLVNGPAMLADGSASQALPYWLLTTRQPSSRS